MNKLAQTPYFFVILLTTLSACTTAKLEARLEANPQCKEVYNSKTGALMPCPGSDKSFYVAAGIEVARKSKMPEVISAAEVSPAQVQTPISQETPATQAMQARTDCKPSIHKKTGGILPCPPLD